MTLQSDTRPVTPPIQPHEQGTKVALIYMLVAIGMSEITQRNAPEVYARANMIERMDGAYRTNNETNNPVYFTPQDIKRFIGLRTNVTTLTRRQFGSRWMKRLDYSNRYYIRETEPKPTPNHRMN